MFYRRSFCLILVLCLFLTLSPYASAGSSQIREQIKELEAQEAQLQSKIDELEKEQSDNLAELTQLVSQKNLLDQQIGLLNQQVLNVQEQISAMKQLIADQQDLCDQAEEDYLRLCEQHKARIRAMEESGTLPYWSVLFRANSFSDFLDRLNMIQEIARADQQRLRQLHAASQRVEEEKQTLLSQQAQLQKTSEDLAASQQLLQEKREQADILLRKLAAQAEAYEALIDEAEKEQEALLLQIAKKEDEFDKAAYLEWLAAQPPAKPTTPSTPVNPSTPDTPKPPSDSGWITPVPYYTLTSPFGMRLHPIYGDYRMHQGIDMACAEGTPIYASRGGQVEIAVYSSTAGNYVQLNHGDGYRSVYMHMTHYIVSAGQYVSPGQVIGYVGNTGASKGNHLHFGVSLNGVYINPYPLIAGK